MATTLNMHSTGNEHFVHSSQQPTSGRSFKMPSAAVIRPVVCPWEQHKITFATVGSECNAKATVYHQSLLPSRD
jgi:hypothetical protein